MKLFLLHIEIIYNASYEGSIETEGKEVVWAKSGEEAMKYYNEDANSGTSIWYKKATSFREIDRVESRMRSSRFF